VVERRQQWHIMVLCEGRLVPNHPPKFGKKNRCMLVWGVDFFCKCNNSGSQRMIQKLIQLSSNDSCEGSLLNRLPVCTLTRTTMWLLCYQWHVRSLFPPCQGVKGFLFIVMWVENLFFSKATTRVNIFSHELLVKVTATTTSI